MSVIQIARLFLFVREAQGKQNSGQRVNAIQVWSGGVAAIGTSWCAWFATAMLDILWQGNCPVKRQGVVQKIRQQCKDAGYQTDSPVEGDLFVYVNADDHGHHMGFYVDGYPDAPTGIAGNTDELGQSSNGDRVAEHKLTTKGTIEYFHIPEAA